MNKFVLSTLLILSSLSAMASQFECRWQNENIKEGPNFYRPASFDLNVTKNNIQISDKDFFDRSYSPCWVGNFASCKFNFEVPENKLPLVQQTPTQLMAEFTSVDEYGLGTLELNFEKNIKDVELGEEVRVIMNADDGDGTYIDESVFECLRLK